MCLSHHGKHGLRFLAEGVLDNHTQCYPLALHILLYRNYSKMSMKSCACLLQVKTLRKFGADSVPQAGSLVLFNHIFLACEKLSGDLSRKEMTQFSPALWGFTAITPANTWCYPLCLSKAHILLGPRTFPIPAFLWAKHQALYRCMLLVLQPQPWEHSPENTALSTPSTLSPPKNPNPPPSTPNLPKAFKQWPKVQNAEFNTIQGGTEGKDEAWAARKFNSILFIMNHEQPENLILFYLFIYVISFSVFSAFPLEVYIKYLQYPLQVIPMLRGKRIQFYFTNFHTYKILPYIKKSCLTATLLSHNVPLFIIAGSTWAEQEHFYFLLQK